MKIFVHIALIAIAAAIGLLIGFAWRGKVVKPQPALASSSSTSHVVAQGMKSGGPNRARKGAANSPSPLTTRLEQDISMSSGVTCWLYWLEALEKAAPADFPHLAQLAKGKPAALRFVSARWVEVAPRHLFDTLVAASKNPGSAFPIQELARTLFNEWPKRDPEAAVAALNEQDSFGMRTQWRWNVAEAIIRQDAERGLSLMSEWHIENYGPSMTAVAKWAAANPQHAAEFTLEHPAGYATQTAIETIGKEWAKTDPRGGLAFAASKSDDLGAQLGGALLKSWTETDRDAAANWLAETDHRSRNRLAPAFVESWAKHDAAAALAWCEANLCGSSLAQAVGGALKGAVQKDVATAAALVAGMGVSAARAEAAVQVAKQYLPGYSFGSEKPASPEAIAWLSQLDPDSVKRVLDQTSWQWARSDPKSMAAFLLTLDSKQVPSYTDTALARLLVRQNPMEAMEWASRLPEKRALEAGGGAFAEWRNSQPEAAMKWLNDLQATDERRRPFLESAIRSLAWQPQAADQLVALVGPNRDLAQSVIENMKLPDDQRNRLLLALGKK